MKTMKNIIWLFALALMAGLAVVPDAACAATATTAPSPGSVIITVTDGPSPVAAATVSGAGQTLSTDPAGKAIFNNLKTAMYNFVVDKPGYHPGSTNLAVTTEPVAARTIALIEKKN